mmetsp:Transcript_75650/g.182838  ORF Transcript_75650/g.182838 Transcript_75650/m.182838 type:complete len:228 (+) Transcript_75650:257-940(+)
MHARPPGPAAGAAAADRARHEATALVLRRARDDGAEALPRLPRAQVPAQLLRAPGLRRVGAAQGRYGTRGPSLTDGRAGARRARDAGDAGAGARQHPLEEAAPPALHRHLRGHLQLRLPRRPPPHRLRGTRRGAPATGHPPRDQGRARAPAAQHRAAAAAGPHLPAQHWHVARVRRAAGEGGEVDQQDAPYWRHRVQPERRRDPPRIRRLHTRGHQLPPSPQPREDH